MRQAAPEPERMPPARSAVRRERKRAENAWFSFGARESAANRRTPGTLMNGERLETSEEVEDVLLAGRGERVEVGDGSVCLRAARRMSGDHVQEVVRTAVVQEKGALPD